MSILLRLKSAALALAGSTFRTNLIADMTDIETEVNRIAAEADALAVSVTENWMSGTTYATGKLVRSPANTKIYKRLTDGAGTTDPSADTTNWSLVTFPADMMDFSNFSIASDNPIINGEFLIDQRNEYASVALTGGGAQIRLADMWVGYSAGTSGGTAQVITGPLSLGFANKLKLLGALTTTGVAAIVRVEAGANGAPFNSATVTLRAIVAGYGGLTSVTWRAFTNTTYGDFGTATQIATGTFNVTAADAAHNVSFAMDANAINGISILFECVTSSPTVGFSVTGVDLVVGSVSRPYPHLTYDKVLAQARRYLYKIKPGVSNAPLTQLGVSFSATQLRATNKFPVTMRIAPTALEQTGSAADYQVVFGGATSTTCSAVPQFFAATNEQAVSTFTVASGLVAGSGGYGANDTGITAAYLAWSAEL